ncbi:MAG: hypothetical protein CMF63_01255 [Magnetovibrio sp.]|nr:hypothetical protein [Magnetovibrio sp.]
MLGAFDVIVFGSEIDKKLASRVIAKWNGPIRISIQGRVKPRYRRWIRTHLKTLAALTGLRFEIPTAGKTAANFYILFVRRSEMAKVPIKGVDPRLLEKLAAPGGCYFLTAKKPPSRIVMNYVVINSEREETGINHCLLEEISQSLGLPNDSDAIRPSIFSDRDRLTRLAPSDEILLKTLYHPLMRPGLPRAQALARARKIIAGLAASPP